MPGLSAQLGRVNSALSTYGCPLIRVSGSSSAVPTDDSDYLDVTTTAGLKRTATAECPSCAHCVDVQPLSGATAWTLPAPRGVGAPRDN